MKKQSKRETIMWKWSKRCLSILYKILQGLLALLLPQSLYKWDWQCNLYWYNCVGMCPTVETNGIGANRKTCIEGTHQSDQGPETRPKLWTVHKIGSPLTTQHTKSIISSHSMDYRDQAPFGSAYQSWLHSPHWSCLCSGTWLCLCWEQE
jgi:hypothetical protein